MSKMAEVHIWQATIITLCFLAMAQGARWINVQEQMFNLKRSLLEGPHKPRELLGLMTGEELEEEKVVKTAQGKEKIKFQETYDGVPIVGASAVLEADAPEHFTGVSSGHLITDINDDISTPKPKLNTDEALLISMRANRHDRDDIQFDKDIDSRLEIIMEEGKEEDRPIARLVYRISYMVQTNDDLERPFSLVDAVTGDIIKQWNGLSLNNVRDVKPNRVKGEYELSAVGGNLKIGKAVYGEEFPKLKAGLKCVLENNVAKIYACQGSRCSKEPFTFDCKQGFNDSVNGAYSPMTDALFYISATYEMFDKWYNIQNPLQRKGSTETVCKARIHFGYRYENAFWNGHYITFGDGYNEFYPLTSINVVAHEISHGITEMNSGLIYAGESGGMNEAFSDMAGEAVEYYATQNQDWMVGYEIFKDPKGALRYFDEPGKDGKSAGELKEYCPGMDVHHSSGLFNRAFYFLGKTPGWDIKKAFHPFVLANQVYWTENSRFFEGACGVVQAAKDLGMNDSDVTEAFRKVGLEPCVDTSRGFINTVNLNAPVGHTIRVQAKLQDEMEIDRVIVRVVTHVTATAQLKSPTCNHCVEELNGFTTKTFEVCQAKAGIYELALTPTDVDMWRSAVAFFGPPIPIQDNITLSGYMSEYDFDFEMPAKLDKFNLHALVNLRVEYGFVRAYMRHGEQPDVENGRFDHVMRPGPTGTLICNPKPGTWYVKLVSKDYKNRGISLDLEPVLNGKRVDIPPATDAPPPEEEGSGEGRAFH